MNLSSFKRPFILIAIALALPVLAILILQFYRLIEERRNIEREAMALAQELSLYGDMQIETDLSTMRITATTAGIMNGEWARARERLSQIVGLNPHWKNAFIIDLKTGQPILDLKGFEKLVLPSSLASINPETPIIDGVLRQGAGCPCFYLYAAVPSSNPPRYALGVAISPAKLQNIIMSRTPAGYLAAVVDKTGHFVARTLHPEKLIGELASSSLRGAAAKGDTGIYSGFTLEGVENYTGFETSKLSGWSFHMAVPSAMIDRPALWSSLIAGLACMVAFAVAGGMILYIITQFESGVSARLASIVQSSDDIIISKNLNGVITSWNFAAEQILGFTAEEAVGKHISLIIPQDRLMEENEIISKIKAGERVSHFETERMKKNGELIALSITVSPLKDKSNRIVGASKIARDISERKIHEMLLHEERDALETLNRLSPKIAASLDLESLVQTATDEATRLIGANFGAFFYNVTNDDGKALLLYTLSGAPREAFEHFGLPRATALFGPSFRGEGTIISADVTQDPRYGLSSPHHGMPAGHLPVRSYLAVPVVSRSGEVIGVLLFGHRDVDMFTERDARLAEGIAALAAVGIDNARLYDQVVANQKRAEEASRTKSDFLATMSHEIRTPMNAIVGLSHILEATASEKQVQFVKTLQSAADSLLVLINDLLDISRIEAKGFELEEIAFSVGPLLQEIHDLLGPKAQEKNITFNLANTADHHVFLGDVTRLRQIISNLCSNALKFTEHGGVMLSASVNTIDEKAARLSITVKDTGIGIAKEKTEIIFEKFTQADTSINRRYGGTGLGLSITKSLVVAMGGQIMVDSALGEGSTFIVTLPLKLAKKGQKIDVADNVSKSSPRTQNARILLVEDYEPNVVVATAFLEIFGYAYDVARNGLDAIDKIKRVMYDAVLMDLQMPGMNGFEATKIVRELENKALADIPIIGMTAHAMAGDREKCLQSGMDDYISKPFNPADLREKLAAAVMTARQKKTG